MVQACDVLITGTGFFAENLAFDLAITAERPIRVAIGGRRIEERARMDWLGNTANARAALFGRPASFSPAPIVWETPETIAETIAACNPRVIAHSATLERHLIEASPGIGLIDGTTGRLDATVDGLPVAVHEGIVNLLAQAVRKGLG